MSRSKLTIKRQDRESHPARRLQLGEIARILPFSNTQVSNHIAFLKQKAMKT